MRWRLHSSPMSHPDAGKLLLPALNNMIDMATTRTMALQLHPPRIVYCASVQPRSSMLLLAGYRMAIGQQRSWIHILCFSVITIIVVYVILDVEYPRAGLIRLEASDQMLVQVRENMK